MQVISITVWTKNHKSQNQNSLTGVPLNQRFVEIMTNLWGICVSRSCNDLGKIFRNSLDILLAGSLTDCNLPTYNVFPNPEIPFTKI